MLTRCVNFDEAAAQGDGNGLRSVLRAELSHRPPYVLVHGPLGDQKNLANIRSGLAACHPGEDFALSRRDEREHVAGINRSDLHAAFGRQAGTWRCEFMQVLRLMEAFRIEDVTAAVRDAMAELELIEREGRMVERRIKAAKFSAVKSLDSFDFAAL
jgi:hypothetical protein